VSVISNYGSMQARIAADITNSQVGTADVQNAIQDAIAEYERESFYFNEVIYDINNPLFVTVVGQEYYPDSALATQTLPYIADLVIVQGGVNRYTLRRWTQGWMTDTAVTQTWRGLSTDWCYTAENIRLYPIPDNNYQICLDGVTRFTNLSGTADTNCWMTDAEYMVRQRAQAIIYGTLLRNKPMADSCNTEAQRGWVKLKGETAMRKSSGKVRIRSYF